MARPVEICKGHDMNTPAHLIFGLAAFGKPDAAKVTAAALVGALIPDLSLYLLSGWHLFILSTPPETVFGQLYYSEGWQRIFRVDNSILLWALALILAVMARSPVTIALCAAALLHLFLDFPLHNDDARAHFWPLTNWKFISPVSYWDGDHYGNIVGPIEMVMVVAAAVYLWRRFTGMLMRVFVCALAAVQVAPVLIWLIFFQGGA